MDLEWDEAKRRGNLAKHRIDFTAIEDFEWETAVIEPSDRDGETRWAATGYIGDRLHWVVYTERDSIRRIISLRKATPKERRDYAKA